MKRIGQHVFIVTYLGLIMSCLWIGNAYPSKSDSYRFLMGPLNSHTLLY